jgi:hypothetical protein
MDQPVVRHRLAKCGAQLEAQWAWTESFVYAMVKLPKEDADVELGGLTAAAKAQAGVVLLECANCAVLLFGGNGYTRSGQGEIAESKSMCENIRDTNTDNEQKCGGKYLETVFRVAAKMSCLTYRSDNWLRIIRTRRRCSRDLVGPQSCKRSLELMYCKRFQYLTTERGVRMH